jgi:hypothetical protein
MRSSGLSLSLTLVLAPVCFGAISPVGGEHANTVSVAAPAKLTINYSSHKGNTVVIACGLANSSYSIQSITDTGGSAWTKRAASTSTGIITEIWTTAPGGSSASASFTITPSAPVPMSCTVQEYSGVMALGRTAYNAGNSNMGTISIMTQDPDNYVVASITVGAYNGQSAAVGKLRQNGGVTSNLPPSQLVGNALTDNTAPTASNVTCTNSFGREPWAAAAIEFRSVGSGKK